MRRTYNEHINPIVFGFFRRIDSPVGVAGRRAASDEDGGVGGSSTSTVATREEHPTCGDNYLGEPKEISPLYQRH